MKNLLPNYLEREEGSSSFVTKFVKAIKEGQISSFMEQIGSNYHRPSLFSGKKGQG